MERVFCVDEHPVNSKEVMRIEFRIFGFSFSNIVFLQLPILYKNWLYDTTRRIVGVGRREKEWLVVVVYIMRAIP